MYAGTKIMGRGGVSMKVYSYKGCGTCRKALKFLEARKTDFELIAIREQPPTVAELERMLAAYQGNLRRLFNTSGRDYKDLGIKDKLAKMPVKAALALLSKNGNLVKRPFVLTAKGGVVGFNPEEWAAVL